MAKPRKMPAAAKTRRKPSPPPGVDASLLADLMGWAKTAGADSAEAFYIHGDSQTSPGNGSTGCIVLPYAARKAISDAGGGTLTVVAGAR